MASLTPGVLSKLLENAGNKHVKVTGEHRSALLQVIEIVPSHDDDPFRSRGFFLKLSDSLHSAYVSISQEDIDLIFSDKIQLGQFVYVSRFDLGSPVPVVCGLKVVPKRRPCVGSPKDLVSSDLLQIRASVDFKKESDSNKGSKNSKKDTLVKRLDPKTKRLMFDDSKTKLREDDKLGNKRGEGLELRRLSFDSARKAWVQCPTPKTSTKIAPCAKAKKSVKTPRNAASVVSDKKDSSNHVSSMKRPSISPMTNKNEIFSPNSMKMLLEKDFKSSTERTIPCHLAKVALNNKTWSSRKISFDVLPTAIQNLGKEAVCNRNDAFLAAVYALEEASASDAVIYCLQAFAELCNSKEVSAGSRVEQFLDVHQKMQKATMVVNSLINTGLPEAKSSTYCGSWHFLPDVCSTLTRKNAMSWVHAAIETDLSKFSVFRKPENSKIVGGEKYYYVILENTAKEVNSENHSPANKPSSRNCGSLSDLSGKWGSFPPKQHLLGAKNMNPERKERSKGGLKEAAILAEKLLMISHQWFLKYLEDSLNTGFGFSGKGSLEIAHLLKQLKRVNKWLDDLVGIGTEADERVEDLREKLYRFLLEHVDSTVTAVK